MSADLQKVVEAAWEDRVAVGPETRGEIRQAVETVFGVVLPYLALVLFLGGLIVRVVAWANIPVPFRIPTTSGQQK